MRELKNCPNCGGTLDDTGRCMYCNSKVYDISDIKIDPYSREPIYLQFMYGNETVMMKCYMTDVKFTTNNVGFDTYRGMDGRLHRIESEEKHKLDLSFIEY